MREIVSCRHPQQLLQKDLHHLSVEERQDLLTKTGIKIKIPTEQGLAMKTNVAMTWKGMREIRM